MKRIYLAVFSVLMVSLGFSARAAQFNHSGAQFLPQNPGISETGLSHWGGSVWNTAPDCCIDLTALVASVDYSPSASGATLYVDGYSSVPQEVLVYLFMLNQDGTVMTYSVVFVPRQAGAWEVPFSLSGAQTSSWASVRVAVGAPAGSSQLVYGVTVVSY